MPGPNKNKLYPNEQLKTVCYIANLPKRPNVEIGEFTYYSDNHNSPENFYDHIQHHYEFLGDKLIIGNDVWIGQNVTIMPGIQVGDGAIIAANSTVTRHVEPYSIVGGNPAQLIRMRFDAERIDLLLQLRWWDWPEQRIFEYLDTLTSANDIASLKKLLGQ